MVVLLTVVSRFSCYNEASHGIGTGTRKEHLQLGKPRSEGCCLDILLLCEAVIKKEKLEVSSDGGIKKS